MILFSNKLISETILFINMLISETLYCLWTSFPQYSDLANHQYLFFLFINRILKMFLYKSNLKSQNFPFPWNGQWFTPVDSHRTCSTIQHKLLTMHLTFPHLTSVRTIPTDLSWIVSTAGMPSTSLSTSTSLKDGHPEPESNLVAELDIQQEICIIHSVTIKKKIIIYLLIAS